MTFTWSPAIKEAIESNVFTEKFYDFMKNWVVSGLAPSDGGSGILNVATGICWINGWRVEVTVQETIDLSTPDGTRYVYVELTKDGAGKVTAVDLADYGSPQTEDIRILIATPLIASGLISAVNDARQYDPFETTLIRLKDDVGLDAWQHTSDLGKIDGAEIYDASIVNAGISPTADIEASKILLTGTTQLSEWRHASDLTKIDGGDIYASSILDAALAGSISWSKISKTGSNLNEIATRSHTVLSDKGSNSHPTIDSHITTANSHFGDSSDPHGSSMSVSTKITTPRIEYSGDLTLESTTGHVWIKALSSGKNIYLSPSGKVYINDDLVMSGRVMTESGDLELFSTGNMTIESGVEYIALDGEGGYVRVGVDTRSSASAYDEGGIRPGSNEQGFLGFFDSGVTELAWRVAYVESMYDDDGSLGSYSEREDLVDLRKIEEVLDPETGEKVRNSWGDPIFDAGSVPEYIKRKQHIEAHVGTEKEGRGYIKSGRFKGWVISLFKKLDEIDTTQDEKLLALFDELVAIKSRLDAIEQA